jgi:hypothetical protein
MVGRRGFDVPGAKPAGLSYMRLVSAPVRNRAGLLLSILISIGTVREVTLRGAI